MNIGADTDTDTHLRLYSTICYCGTGVFLSDESIYDGYDEDERKEFAQELERELFENGEMEIESEASTFSRLKTMFSSTDFSRSGVKFNDSKNNQIKLVRMIRRTQLFDKNEGIMEVVVELNIPNGITFGDCRNDLHVEDIRNFDKTQFPFKFIYIQTDLEFSPCEK